MGELVLGAYGCGVFRNDPWDVAEAFHFCLFGEPRLACMFKRIVFAVPDCRGANHQAFKARFGGGSPGVVVDQCAREKVTDRGARSGKAASKKDGRKAARWRKNCSTEDG